jgi:hypothetical protein
MPFASSPSLVAASIWAPPGLQHNVRACRHKHNGTDAQMRSMQRNISLKYVVSCSTKVMSSYLNKAEKKKKRCTAVYVAGRQIQRFM